MNNLFKSLLKIVIITGLGVFLTACSTKKVEKVTIVIPNPPEEPRIFYIDSYHGGSSLSQGNAIDIFIGKETGRASGNLFKPYGVSSYGENLMYVADTAVGVVFKFDIKNKKVSYIGDKSEGRLGMPIGVATDSDGNIYASDSKQKKVFGYTPEGELMFAIGKRNELKRPTGIAVNSKLQRLYVVDTKAHNIKVYSLTDGKELFQFGKRGDEAGEFNFPTNIAIDRRNNNIVVSDTQNFRIQIFDKDGEFIHKFGRIGDLPGMFARPKGVGVDTEGHIYVADAAFNQIQIFDQKGRLLLYFGGHGGEPGTFRQVAGLYVDDYDKVYIVDGISGSVQVYQYVSKKWKEAHPAEYKKLKEYKPKKKPSKPKKARQTPLNIDEQFQKDEKLKKNMLKF